MRHRARRMVTALTVGLLVVVGATTVLRTSQALALNNGVARTPPMGWNSWNTFGCNINETLIRQMTDAMVSSGLRDAGYQYVVVDDCWMNPNRDSAGNLQGDPSRFPSGMKALGDYIHARGLKFGIYQAPLDRTCAQFFGSYPGATGSQGREAQDARQFAAWGVDYLKYDWCSPSGTIDDQVRTFARMRDALAATGRPIVLSINSNSIHTKTGPQRDWGDVSNMWRTTEDITNAWNTGQTNGYPMGIQNIVDVTVPLAARARPGAFNDMDMMEVGRGGMSDTEMRSHFALWSILASPLIAGNDLRNMNAATRTILTNTNLIGISQDPLGLQATQVSFDGTRRVLAKRLSNGDVAVALFNQGTATTTISTTASAIGLSGGSFTLREAWTNATSTTSGAISASVPGHGTVVYRVSGGPGTPTSTPTGTPTAVPTTVTPPPSAGNCQVTYAITGQWPAGFQGDVTVRNTGTTPIDGWSLRWSFANGQQVNQAWGATYTQSGAQVTATNVAYNASISPGGTATFGFISSWSGSNTRPNAFTLNGQACGVA
ncbi:MULTISPECIES: cellulose binding domain-containing protein [Micromonospora]|uniref:Alpha-galactosidase n=1 Tax=Micromonospora yangpuensis TaxID=683228 RepID=A0A1C6UMD8_9ACTN|nr:cellulose binding domain-containing protein [Micromonospora yangpuensis]GGM27752.1 alpha-galactosidase [Micromonospora yangpuensis]SCL55171.1 alpha-galactosidase [Micromonospora yangpuensis]